MKTIKDIEDINLNDCCYYKNEYNEKVVTLSFYHKNFQHSIFKSCSKGDYIILKGKRYYYPYSENKLLI